MYVVVVGDSSETSISLATFSVAHRRVCSSNRPLGSTEHLFCRSLSCLVVFRYVVFERELRTKGYKKMDRFAKPVLRPFGFPLQVGESSYKIVALLFVVDE